MGASIFAEVIHVRWHFALSALLATAALGGCDVPTLPQAAPEEVKTATPAPMKRLEPVNITDEQLALYKPLPERYESDKNPISDAKVKLGRTLYYDTRLSLGQDISCNSCHDLETYGVDHAKTSTGHKKQLGGRNSPTVYNAAGNVAQFWDGRAATVEEQAKGPILNPVEMAMPDDKHVIEVLESIPGYEKLFKAAFPDEKEPITYDNLAKAIGAFERQLMTPSRWDKFLKGEKDALTDEEKAGFLKFSKTGCPTCHTGPNVGGGMFQKLGLVKPYPDQHDLGRFDVTKNEVEKMVFRVPSLRNAEKTAPYFHDGSIATLEDAVRTMALYQNGVELKDDEVQSIVTFLKALTGDIPKDYIQKPELPESGKKTPKPKLD